MFSQTRFFLSILYFFQCNRGKEENCRLPGLLSTQKESIENILNDYFLSLRMNWANTNETIVRITQIETRILSINGIVDISGTKINGLEQNLVIPSHMIPVLEGVYNE